MVINLNRKKGLLLINVLVIITAALKVVAKFVNLYELLWAGRFVQGLYSGLFSGIAPLYLSECSPKNLRGVAGTMQQLFVVIGILVSSILGLNLSKFDENYQGILGTKDLWHILVGLILVPCVVHLLLFGAVESPKYLFFNKNDKQAAEKGNYVFYLN